MCSAICQETSLFIKLYMLLEVFVITTVCVSILKVVFVRLSKRDLS